MKRFFWILLYLIPIIGYSQVSNLPSLRIQGDATAFGKNVPAGTILTDIGGKKVYLLLQSVGSASTLSGLVEGTTKIELGKASNIYWTLLGNDISNDNSGYVIISPGVTGNTTGFRLGDGDTGVSEWFDDIYGWYFAGSSDPSWYMSSTGFGMYPSGSYIRATSFGTEAAFLPNASDTDTGLGSTANDILSLYAGSRVGIEVDEATTIGTAKIIFNDYGTGSITGTDTYVLGVNSSGDVLEKDFGNWDTAYGWGDHSSAGYITDLSSFTTDNLNEGSTNLYSQWITNGADIYYDTGNVGIGRTPSSGYLLDIYDTGISRLGIFSNTSSSVLTLGSVLTSGTSTGTIAFQHGGVGTYSINSSTSTGFYISNATATSTILTGETDGDVYLGDALHKVGLGVTPSASLPVMSAHVGGQLQIDNIPSSTSDNILVEESNVVKYRSLTSIADEVNKWNESGTGTDIYYNEDDGVHIGVDDGDGITITGGGGTTDVEIIGTDGSTETLGLSASGDSYFTGGDVGIGTTSPSAPLEVSGRVSQTGLGNSTFFGYQAGNADDLSANNNSAFGYQALYSNTTGSYNTASGYQALYYNTTGSANTASGYYALFYNTTGSNNTASGYLALFSNTTGIYNFGIGSQAGRYLADGSSPNETGSYNFYLGANTKASADGNTNETVIGYNATGNGSNTVTIGNTSVTDTYLGGYIHANNAYKFPNADGTDGQVLTSDGAGTVSWEDVSYTETDPVFTAWDKSTGISITASQVSDFDTEVSNNSSVSANTAKVGVTTDGINDTHIDWGTGGNQVSTDDITEGSTNKWDDDDGVVGAYGSGWNGDTDAPTKNAVYDKIESLPDPKSETITIKSSIGTTLTSTESGEIFLLNFASGGITLPTAVAGLRFKFIATSASTSRVDIYPNTSDIIVQGSSSTSAGIRTTQQYDSVELVSIDASTWVVMSANATWSFL